MTNPDRLVEKAGEPVEVNRLTSAVLSNNELDPDASTFETVTINGIASELSYKDRRRLEGKADDASLKLTIPSTADVEATRDFRPDRVRYPATTGAIYEVAEVRTVRHPIASIDKKTIVLEPLPGRSGLSGV